MSYCSSFTITSYIVKLALYCNCLFYSINSSQMKRLQTIQAKGSHKYEYPCHQNNPGHCRSQLDNAFRVGEPAEKVQHVLGTRPNFGTRPTIHLWLYAGLCSEPNPADQKQPNLQGTAVIKAGNDKGLFKHRGSSEVRERNITLSCQSWQAYIRTAAEEVGIWPKCKELLVHGGGMWPKCKGLLVLSDSSSQTEDKKVRGGYYDIR